MIRKLSIGIQDFEKLRRGSYVYVDKTDYIYQLTQLELPYFLGPSAPLRKRLPK